MSNQQCQYVGPNGELCQHCAEINDFCYWHDKSKDKTEPDLVTRLEKRARSGEPMIGFCLRGANLKGIDLVNHNKKIGFKLCYADLYHCDLSEAHLFNIDLTGSSLMKARINHTNLNCANLHQVNMLGLRLDDVKMDHIRWDDTVIQEIKALKEKDKKVRFDLLEQAEEIYRSLRKATEAQGLFESAGHFFKREMTMRRLQMPKISSKRVLSKLVDLFCGYGEEPSRVVIFSLIIILTFSLVYFLLGISDGSNTIKFSTELSLLDNLENIIYATYFSVVTFTTLGYGDLVPMGFARLFAAIEAFLGSFTLALFVVVFVKKMTR
jgi:hypothetical protein